jgi:adenine-specific DNA-methyltransferase
VRRKIRRKVARETSVVNNKVQDYRFADEKRKNIPDAGLASFYKEKRECKKYEYDPHLDPQLIWAGKVENASFEVDTVALHIHERISSKAILETVEKKELFKQLKLFGEPDLPLDKRIEFYQHDMDWTNRLILGDSLLVMNSLLEREMMVGKVQMIYMDPPYGISYKSNFQPSINKKDVQDGQDDSMTREPEQIKAYRDTWVLGIHSYLAYLKDRLVLCRELLNESGSIFVQINEVNLPFVRLIMNEVFGSDNFVTQIPFVKTGAQTSERGLPTVVDYILWYAKDRECIKVRQLFTQKDLSPETAQEYPFIQMPDGSRRRLTSDDIERIQKLPKGSRLFQLQPLHSQHFSKTRSVPFGYKGRTFVPPPNRQWATSKKTSLQH